MIQIQLGDLFFGQLKLNIEYGVQNKTLVLWKRYNPPYTFQYENARSNKIPIHIDGHTDSVVGRPRSPATKQFDIVAIKERVSGYEIMTYQRPPAPT